MTDQFQFEPQDEFEQLDRMDPERPLADRGVEEPLDEGYAPADRWPVTEPSNGPDFSGTAKYSGTAKTGGSAKFSGTAKTGGSAKFSGTAKTGGSARFGSPTREGDPETLEQRLEQEEPDVEDDWDDDVLDEGDDATATALDDLAPPAAEEHRR